MPNQRDINKRYIGVWVDKELKRFFDEQAKSEGIPTGDLVLRLLIAEQKRILISSKKK